MDGLENRVMMYPQIRSLRLSHSTIQTFRSCARKFEFRKLYLHPAFETSLPAEVGTAIHKGWQTWMETNDEDEAIFQLALAYPYMLSPDGANDRSLEASISTLLALINAVQLSEWEIATVKKKDGTEVPAIEVPFEFKIKNLTLDEEGLIPITYVGKIDAILRHRYQDRFGVNDLKTHRDKVKDLTAKYAFDEQCVPYGLVLENIISPDLTGFDVNYISAFVDLLEPRVSVYNFNKSLDDIKDWAQRLRIDLQLIKMYYQMQWFPRDAGSCMNFGKKCWFFDICPERNIETLQGMIGGGVPLEKLIADSETRFGEPWFSMELDLGL